MNIDQPNMDPIEAFLGQGAGEKTNEKLRLAIQQKTLGVLRRRRWVLRGGWLTGLAACYAAGILTMRLWPKPDVSNQVAIAPEENAVGQPSMAPPASTTYAVCLPLRFGTSGAVSFSSRAIGWA